ncbi:MAG: magnesium transporter CorA family protein [Alphaproteobacteria bacterium]|nr:magnesium transporter CorA family protein [Alphaproteobacteria bacterium]
MLKCYFLQGEEIQSAPLEEFKGDINALVWVDIFSPTKHEEELAESVLNISIPTRDEMHEIEFTSRLYHRHQTLYATTIFVTKSETSSPESHAITFILHGTCLISVRYVDILPFTNFLKWVKTLPAKKLQGKIIMAAMLEIFIDQMADMLENVGRKIDDVTAIIFQRNQTQEEKHASSINFKEVLSRIGLIGDLLSKSRESLLTVSRMLGYLLSSEYFNQVPDDQKRIEMMLRDIASLSDHASFLSNKVNFMLDASLGMINSEQNRIIKIFSVAAVVFLPPTLVASIYGMNFKAMPELEWPFGYPFAILLMVLSAYLPYKFFKKKGWL